MTLADVLAVLSGLVIAGSGFASISVILTLLFPRVVARAESRVSERPGRSFALGLFAFLLVVVLFGGLLKSGPAGHLGAVALLVGGLSLAVLGGAAMAASLARRYRLAPEGPLSIRDLLRGVFLLEGAALFPVVGWFVVLPGAFLVSLGTGVYAVLRRGATRAVAAPIAQA